MKIFARFVPAPDPDMTVHEDINQILLQENIQSQSAKRKLDLLQVSSENCKSVENFAEELNVSHSGNIETMVEITK